MYSRRIVEYLAKQEESLKPINQERRQSATNFATMSNFGMSHVADVFKNGTRVDGYGDGSGIFPFKIKYKKHIGPIKHCLQTLCLSLSLQAFC